MKNYLWLLILFISSVSLSGCSVAVKLGFADKNTCYHYEVINASGRYYYTDQINYIATGISFHDNLTNRDIEMSNYTIQNTGAHCNQIFSDND